MDVLECGGRQMRNDVFVVYYAEGVRYDQMNIRGQIGISDSWTSIDINVRDLRGILSVDEEI